MIVLALGLLGLISLSGYGFLYSLFSIRDRTEGLALGYILGIGVITNLFFLLNWLFSFAFTLNNTIILVSLFFISSTLSVLLSDYKGFIKSISLKRSNLSWPEDRSELMLLGLLALVFIVPFISSTYWPVKDWDSLVLYDFRAKTFIATGFMEDGISRGYFFGYPLLVSIAHTLVGVLGYPYPGIVHSLFYGSFILLLILHLQNHVNKKWALFWTFLIVSFPALFGHAHMTYTNLMYTIYLVLGYLYLVKALKDKSSRSLIISGLLIGLSTWTRSAEPFWLLPVVIGIVIAIYKKKFLITLVYPFLVYAFKQPWSLFEKAHGISTSSVAANAPSYLEVIFKLENWMNMLEVVPYVWKNIVLYQFPIISLFCIVSYLHLKTTLKQKRRVSIMDPKLLLLGAIILNFLFVLAGVFIFSVLYEDWVNIGGSAQRMTIFIAPLILFYSSLVLHSLLYPRVKR